MGRFFDGTLIATRRGEVSMTLSWFLWSRQRALSQRPLVKVRPGKAQEGNEVYGEGDA